MVTFPLIPDSFFSHLLLLLSPTQQST
uniref:Uncharacterized protein n=1 Tax=Anguilla anguilla TaxID=7936 RepID=A0A0E9T505_ANGAN